MAGGSPKVDPSWRSKVAGRNLKLPELNNIREHFDQFLTLEFCYTYAYTVKVILADWRHDIYHHCTVTLPQIAINLYQMNRMVPAATLSFSHLVYLLTPYSYDSRSLT